MQKKFSLIFINFALLFGGLSVTNTKVSAEEGAPPAYTPVAGELGTRKLDLSEPTDADVNAYYDGSRDKADVNGLKGDALLAALYDNIRDHEEYTYASLGPVYKITDRNWDFSPLTAAQEESYKFTHTTDESEGDDNPYLVKLYADYNDDINTADKYRNEEGGKVTFDKEHIWAQSLGYYGRGMGAGSDLHALWPSDRLGNQQAHSNYNYATPTIDRKGYPNDKGDISGYNGKIDGYDAKVFEPLDEFKGDIARAMFYMAARYYEYVDDERPSLALTNGSPSARTALPGFPGLAGDLETLLQWNEEDPVSDFEIRRNDLIALNFQKNRNPFIDHPEWARIAFDSAVINSAAPGASTETETSSKGLYSDSFRLLDLTHLELNTENVKKTYFKEDAFSFAGLAVRAYFSDGSSKVVRNYQSDYEASELLTVTGEQTVNITFTHEKQTGPETSISQTESASYTINVKEITLRDALKISEVYGGGGNTNAPLKSDFVELYNASDESINLAGKSLQHSATTNTATFKVISLEGIIQPKSYFLVHFYTGGSTGVDLPLADLYGQRNMGATDLYVALVNSATPLTYQRDESDVALSINGETDMDEIPEMIDFLGGGGTSTIFALGARRTGGTNVRSYQRKFVDGEVVDTRHNANDFLVNDPTPKNSALSVAEKILLNNVPTVEVQEGEDYAELLETANKDQCLTRYEPAKEMVLKLSDDVYEENENGIEKVGDGQLTYFKEGDYGIMPDGRLRYEAWAVANGDAYPYELIDQETNEQPTSVVINTAEGYIYVLIMTFAIFGGYFVLRRKKA
ncbi:MAG TPA: endonuclease [Bacilli bacterium]|nr:endonuclease [Bacilli bacterium]